MALRGGGECGALLRALDWDENPLGRPETWPPELRTVVSIALGSQQPMLIVWGPQQITLYNDGYAVMCGNRHPQALGRPFRDLWFDIWDQVDPIISAAYNGVSTAMDDIEFIMHRKGYPEETHFAFSYTPVRDSDGVVLGMFCACVETTAQVTMQKRLTRERAQMQHVFEMALGAVAILDGPDYVVTFTNREYEMLAGRGGLVGKPLVVSLPEAADQGFIERLDQVYKSGQPYIGRNAPVEIQPVPSGPKQTRTIDFLYHPVHEVDGRVGGIFVQVLDVTERAGAERQQKLLNLELSHRMKNQLALVQAIANLTMRTAPDLTSARAALTDRIGILAHAHDVLLSGRVKNTTLGAIVSEVTGLHDDGGGRRFRTSGPAIGIDSGPALSLSLFLHELATNSVKYGALSVEGGSVAIDWQSQPAPDGDRSELTWVEAGGPPVREPTRLGSGSRLLRAGLSGSASSSVILEFVPTGVRCSINAVLIASKQR